MKNLPLYFRLPGNTLLTIKQGDLTLEDVDVIVNAANRHLQHGGGIAWAIVRRGGPSIQRDSDAWVHAHGLVPHEHPAMTTAGDMPSCFVFHAVGPVWGSGEEEQKLYQAIEGCLVEADRRQLASIAFPAISTGIFGFPKELAATVFFRTFQNYFSKPEPHSLQDIRLVLFDQPTIEAFVNALAAFNFPEATL